ncbi:MAG: sugar ABC transporter ATP-binding protein [Lachnospiraceae bacterium]|nr:sugar ABC transporter ATP-binding protein [Lachnospiraceae bacterium]
MRKEVFRMERVTYKEQGITLLEDFNFNVLEGEIMGFIPFNSHGMASFLRLLKTNLPLDDGYIYYHEEIINSWKGAKQNSNRITVIQDKTCLVKGMTVADNIFVLRQGFKQHIIKPSVLNAQLEPFLKDIDMDLLGEAYAEKLTIFERVVVEILKGIVAGHKLIVLCEISTLISGNELKKLHKIMRHYAKQGHSFIYIGSHFEDIIQVCNRAVLLSNGRIEKILQPREMYVDNLFSLTKDYDKLVRGYLENKKAGSPKGKLVCKLYAEINSMKEPLEFVVISGECLVIQSLDNQIYHELLQILTNSRETAFYGNAWLGDKEFRLQELNTNRNFAVIQEMPTKTMLFTELSYMDNLCFNLDKRMRSVWARGNIRRSIRTEYAPILGDEVFNMTIEELSEGQKYQLVYTRILLQKPKIVFCIQPFKGADMKHRMYIWELLEKLLEKGIAVVILAVNLADTLSLADRLICIDKNKEQIEYLQEEFAALPMLAPWLYLYREDSV